MTPKTIGLQSALTQILKNTGEDQTRLLTELLDVGNEVLGVLGIDGVLSFRSLQGLQGIPAAQALLASSNSIALTLVLTNLRAGATAVITAGGVSCGLSVLNGVPLPVSSLPSVNPAPTSLLQLVDLLKKTAEARDKTTATPALT